MDPPIENRDSDGPLLSATSETLAAFHDDVQYLWCSEIKVYEDPPTALHFLRNHVALSRPCIIRNSILANASDASAEIIDEHKSKVPLTMTLDELVRLFPKDNDSTSIDGNDVPSRNGSSSSLPPLCVDVTPDGHGDCLRRVNSTNGKASEEERIFVKPMEMEMSLADFCTRLRKGRAKQQERQQKQNCRESYQEEILDKAFGSSCKSNPDEEDKDRNYNDDFFEDCVLYYSRQNDCLREELSPLWNLKLASYKDAAGEDDDEESFLFPRSFPWAEEAFFGQSSSVGSDSAGSSVGVGPDAVNLWVGDERAVSAMHKDHYENLFYVLSGEKVFGLCPPSDAPFLYEQEVLSGRFEVSGGQFKDDTEAGTCPSPKWSVTLDRVEEDDVSSISDNHNSKVHWIATDLFGNHFDRTDHDKEFPLSKYAHPITVRVRAGELLYLPSLWFHRVTQTEETIGINYWYDMNFESPMWCYFHFLQQLRSQEK